MSSIPRSARRGAACGLDHLLDDGAEVRASGGARLRVRLEARERQDLLHHLAQAQHLLADALQEAPARRLVHLGVLEDGLGEAADRRERGLELVRDVGHELAAHVLEVAQLRDVVQDEDGALHGVGRAAERRRVELQAPVARRGGRHLACAGPSFLERAGEDLVGLVERQEIARRLADGRRGVPAEHAPGRVVHDHDAPAAIDGHDALFHARQDGAQLGAVARDRVDALVELLRHPIERLAEPAELVGGGDVDAPLVVARGERVRRADHGTQRTREAAGDEERQAEAHQHGDRRGPQHAVPQIGLALVDGPSDWATRTVPRGRVAVAHPVRHVEHARLQRVAEADGRP